MRHVPSAALLAVLSAGAIAQDKITLTNGDVLTGTIKVMTEGKVTIVSPVLGEVEVPMESVTDLSTASGVDLHTKTGEVYKRRVLGIEGGGLRLEGDAPPLLLDNLGAINPPPKREAEWTGALALNGLWSEGNTDRRTVGMTFDASLRRDQDRTTFDASWEYSESKDLDETSITYREWDLDARRVQAGFKYDYFLSKRLYSLVTARVLGDTPADIQLRFTAGAGLGYMWIDTEETSFLTELGLSYVSENYRSALPTEEYPAGRFYYKLTRVLSENTKFNHSVEVLDSLEDADDVLVFVKAEVTTKVTGAMIASLAYSLDYDNTPPPEKERCDHRLVLAIGWQF